MKKCAVIMLFCGIFLFADSAYLNAQCSICTKSASQLGIRPAKGLNAGIVYLMLTPLTVAGYLGFKWWRREKEIIKGDSETG